MKAIALALTICVGVAHSAMATSTPEALIDIEEYSPLQHAHLVVRGTVLDVSMERVRFSEWGMGAENSTMMVTSVRVAVASVLRGRLHDREVVFRAIGGLAPLFDVNREYIVCAKWRRLENSGFYVTGTYVGLYGKEGETWARIVTDEPMERKESLTDEEVRLRIERGSLASTTSNANVIARGKIAAIWETQYTAHNGRPGELINYTLEVREIFLGEVPQRFDFVVARVAAYTPDWYRAVPRNIRVGEEWYVFLRRGEHGLYPFAGPNSLLRVEGENLIYDNAIMFPHDLKEVDALIRKEMQHR